MEDDVYEIDPSADAPPVQAPVRALPQRGRAASSAADTVGDDIPCGSCGYNLRGLRMDGLCPECGDRVKLSVRLRWMSDPSVARLRRMGLACQATALALVSNLIVAVIGLISWFYGHDPTIAYVFCFALSTGAIAVCVVHGTFRNGAGWMIWWQSAVRIAACLAAVMAAAVAVSECLFATRSFPYPLPTVREMTTVDMVAMLFWSIEAHRAARRVNVLVHNTVRSWGRVIVALGVASVALLVGPPYIFESCGGYLLVPATGIAMTFYFWMVGRELTA